MLDRDFGKYRLKKRLGRGGMADVYLAHDKVLGRDVALKIVEARDDRDSRDVCEAERRGAILQEQFSRVDDHVPAVHAHGTENGFFYLDMEYVDGEDLAEMIGRGALPASVAASIALELARFLERAHQFDAVVDDRPLHGIIHGDIKPKNVRLNRDGQVKIVDFGIAKGLSLVRSLTRNDFRSSTYSSPERLETGEVDVHADLWSVAVLLYEMLAGHPPFQADTVEGLERRIQARGAIPALPDSVPAGLQRIVFKALAGDRGRRYVAAADFGADLQAWLDGVDTQADGEWLVAAADGEATRRTGHPGSAGEDGDADRTHLTRGGHTRPTPELEATRRTISAPENTVEADETSAPGGGRRVFMRLAPRHRRLLMAGLGVLLVFVFANEARVWSAARDLRSGLPALQPAGIGATWNRYEALRRRSLLGVGLLGLRRPLKERLVAHAERVIADYRHDAPTVREAQWKDAASWLTFASRLDPMDGAVTARLRYCEGHLYRIEGEARKRRKQPAAQSFHEAVVRFEEAGRTDRRWPDPYLGLARTYVYGLDDLDRAIAAFEEAGRRGYRPGLREIAQLGDGYRNRADRMRREADGMRGLAQEADLLEKAASDYRRALDLYQQAIGFGEASTNVRQVQRRLDEVNARLDRIGE